MDLENTKLRPQSGHRQIDLNEDQRGGNEKALKRAWQDFLESHEWSHVATLTFKYDAAPWKATWEFFQWIRHLKRKTQHGVDWFRVIEKTHVDAVHIHALLNVKGDEDHQWLSSWRPGFSKVERYIPGGGWGRYITKDLALDDPHWDCSPSLRRN